MWDVRTLVGNKKLPLYFVKTTPHNPGCFVGKNSEKIIIFTLKIIIQYSLQSCLVLLQYSRIKSVNERYTSHALGVHPPFPVITYSMEYKSRKVSIAPSVVADSRGCWDLPTTIRCGRSP